MKELRTNKVSVLVAESANISQKAQFGLTVCFLFVFRVIFFSTKFVFQFAYFTMTMPNL